MFHLFQCVCAQRKKLAGTTPLNDYASVQLVGLDRSEADVFCKDTQ